ncbi:MAG TPA: sigma-70 family RNA polymerase sigma factor [Candidatus Limnocylindria bacterium]|nr:sigma-70 family RNA polymerase sigma factor [Candidatus Limnocylindria bacterium]
MRELLSGSEEALLELYRRHADNLFRAAVLRLGDRQLAEEVVQDTFLALWNRAELFDARRGTLVGWLSVIARNRSVDMFRQAGRRAPSVPLSAMLPDDQSGNASIESALRRAAVAGGNSVPEPEAALDGAWLRTEVSRALDDIPEMERQVIRLAYYEELSQTEIAARLDWPLGTVKTRTRRALARLRESLAGVRQEQSDGPR